MRGEERGEGGHTGSYLFVVGMEGVALAVGAGEAMREVAVIAVPTLTRHVVATYHHFLHYY